MRILSVAIATTVAAAALTAGVANAAAPRIVIFSGKLLAQPIVISDWQAIFRVFEQLVPARARVLGAALDRLPRRRQACVRVATETGGFVRELLSGVAGAQRIDRLIGSAAVAARRPVEGPCSSQAVRRSDEAPQVAAPRPRNPFVARLRSASTESLAASRSRNTTPLHHRQRPPAASTGRPCMRGCCQPRTSTVRTVDGHHWRPPCAVGIPLELRSTAICRKLRPAARATRIRVRRLHALLMSGVDLRVP